MPLGVLKSYLIFGSISWQKNLNWTDFVIFILSTVCKNSDLKYRIYPLKSIFTVIFWKIFGCPFFISSLIPVLPDTNWDTVQSSVNIQVRRLIPGLKPMFLGFRYFSSVFIYSNFRYFSPTLPSVLKVWATVKHGLLVFASLLEVKSS